MQLHLEGTREIGTSRERVYSLLTDTSFIAKNLKDAEDVHVLDASSIQAKLKVRVSVVSTSLKVKIVIAKTEPPSKAAMTVEGSGSSGSLRISSTFQLSGDKTTTMSWAADAEISGVMAGIGTTILRGFATKKVDEIFHDITGAIETAPGV
ncbi:MAG TPA: SRPBCC domain-containing protein [Nitrososphaerales archaeon]|nr:SRPBCC domain-containing protein [Nitrososphaerales archaeon]